MVERLGTSGFLEIGNCKDGQEDKCAEDYAEALSRVISGMVRGRMIVMTERAVIGHHVKLLFLNRGERNDSVDEKWNLADQHHLLACRSQCCLFKKTICGNTEEKL